MGRKGGYKFGAQLDRNYRAGSKIADDITKGLLLGGLFGVDYVYRKSKQSQSYYTPLTPEEERRIKELEMQCAEPFSFRKRLLLHIASYVLAIISPLIGMFLYCSVDWWMFFCVLLFGALEICFLLPANLLGENIKTGWRFNPSDKEKQVKQIKGLLWLAIVVNLILVILNSYPFLMLYDEGVLVILMTLFLYLVNIWSVVINVQSLKNAGKLFDANVERFNESLISEDTQIPESCQESTSIVGGNRHKSESDKMHQYLSVANKEGMPLGLVKANLRIANAMIDACKAGDYDLSYDVIIRQLELKIQYAKREFVKRECRVAIEIIQQLKCNEAREVVEVFKNQFSIE